MPLSVHRSLTLGALLVLGTTACRKLDPVPEGVDANASWLYRNQASDDEAAIASALVQLRADLALDDMDEFVERLLLPLDAESVEVVGKEAFEALPETERVAFDDEALTEALDAGTLVQLSDQQGMLVASTIPCSIEDTVEVFTRLDQDVIHPDYEAYERVYTSDRDAFDLDTPLSWRTDYTVSVLFSSYEARILGGIRWLQGTDGNGGTRTYAVGRAHLPDPATFVKGGTYFRQDYQFDAFLPTDDGQTIHLFIVWRDMDLGGFHSSNTAYIATVSKAFRDGDKEIASFCAEEE